MPPPLRLPTRLRSYERYFKSPYARADHGGLPPLVLFVFESERAEEVFLNAASFLPGMLVASTTTAVLDRDGVLGLSWLLPAPHGPQRRFVADLRQSDRLSHLPYPAFPVGGLACHGVGGQSCPMETPLFAAPAPCRWVVLTCVVPATAPVWLPQRDHGTNGAELRRRVSERRFGLSGAEHRDRAAKPASKARIERRDRYTRDSPVTTETDSASMRFAGRNDDSRSRVRSARAPPYTPADGSLL